MWIVFIALECLAYSATLPPGSWLKTARHIKLENDILSAELKQRDGTWAERSVAVYDCCYYVNNDGHFKITFSDEDECRNNCDKEWNSQNRMCNILGIFKWFEDCSSRTMSNRLSCLEHCGLNELSIILPKIRGHTVPLHPQVGYPIF